MLIVKSVLCYSHLLKEKMFACFRWFFTASSMTSTKSYLQYYYVLVDYFVIKKHRKRNILKSHHTYLTSFFNYLHVLQSMLGSALFNYLLSSTQNRTPFIKSYFIADFVLIEDFFFWKKVKNNFNLKICF